MAASPSPPPPHAKGEINRHRRLRLPVSSLPLIRTCFEFRSSFDLRPLAFGFDGHPPGLSPGSRSGLSPASQLSPAPIAAFPLPPKVALDESGNSQSGN